MGVKIKKCPDCGSQDWNEIEEEKYVYECIKCGYIDYKSQSRLLYLKGWFKDREDDK